MKNKDQNKRKQVILNVRDYEKLQALARLNERTTSYLIRQLIREHLKTLGGKESETRTG